MTINTKYPRTYHYDFSPGATSDDRVNLSWADDIQQFNTILHTEKLDGESSCLSPLGVFARSHAAPTHHPWADYLKVTHGLIVNDLKGSNLEIFGENLYAIHSIVYPNIEHHFYVFGMRILDKWLSFDEVKWYAEFFDLPVVPILSLQTTINAKLIKDEVLRLASEPSIFGSLEYHKSLYPCTREGIVSRNFGEYATDTFQKNVFKWVRKGHVQTDEHWTRGWKRAKLIWEKS
jgi:hypothetical protein